MTKCAHAHTHTHTHTHTESLHLDSLKEVMGAVFTLWKLANAVNLVPHGPRGPIYLDTAAWKAMLQPEVKAALLPLSFLHISAPL